MDPSTLEVDAAPTFDSPSIACRKLRPGEAPMYRAMRLASLQRYPESFGYTHEEEAGISRLPFETAIDNATPDRFVIGAFAGSRLVGLAGFSRYDRAKARHRGQISQVYVDPGSQGRSVGAALMRALLDAAFDVTGIEQLDLSLVTTNLAAQRLYERLGFETFGIQENFFKLGERTWNQRHMQISRARFQSHASLEIS